MISAGESILGNNTKSALDKYSSSRTDYEPKKYLSTQSKMYPIIHTPQSAYETA